MDPSWLRHIRRLPWASLTSKDLPLELAQAASLTPFSFLGCLHQLQPLSQAPISSHALSSLQSLSQAPISSRALSSPQSLSQAPISSRALSSLPGSILPAGHSSTADATVYPNDRGSYAEIAQHFPVFQASIPSNSAAAPSIHVGSSQSWSPKDPDKEAGVRSTRHGSSGCRNTTKSDHFTRTGSNVFAHSASEDFTHNSSKHVTLASNKCFNQASSNSSTHTSSNPAALNSSIHVQVGSSNRIPLNSSKPVPLSSSNPAPLSSSNPAPLNSSIHVQVNSSNPAPLNSSNHAPLNSSNHAPLISGSHATDSSHNTSMSNDWQILLTSNTRHSHSLSSRGSEFLHPYTSSVPNAASSRCHDASCQSESQMPHFIAPGHTSLSTELSSLHTAASSFSSTSRHASLSCDLNPLHTTSSSRTSTSGHASLSPGLFSTCWSSGQTHMPTVADAIRHPLHHPYTAISTSRQANSLANSIANSIANLPSIAVRRISTACVAVPYQAQAQPQVLVEEQGRIPLDSITSTTRTRHHDTEPIGHFQPQVPVETQARIPLGSTTSNTGVRHHDTEPIGHFQPQVSLETQARIPLGSTTSTTGTRHHDTEPMDHFQPLQRVSSSYPSQSALTSSSANSSSNDSALDFANNITVRYCKEAADRGLDEIIREGHRATAYQTAQVSSNVAQHQQVVQNQQIAYNHEIAHNPDMSGKLPILGSSTSHGDAMESHSIERVSAMDGAPEGLLSREEDAVFTQSMTSQSISGSWHEAVSSHTPVISDLPASEAAVNKTVGSNFSSTHAEDSIVSSIVSSTPTADSTVSNSFSSIQAADSTISNIFTPAADRIPSNAISSQPAAESTIDDVFSTTPAANSTIVNVFSATPAADSATSNAMSSQPAADSTTDPTCSIPMEGSLNSIVSSTPAADSAISNAVSSQPAVYSTTDPTCSIPMEGSLDSIASSTHVDTPSLIINRFSKCAPASKTSLQAYRAPAGDSITDPTCSIPVEGSLDSTVSSTHVDAPSLIVNRFSKCAPASEASMQAYRARCAVLLHHLSLPPDFLDGISDTIARGRIRICEGLYTRIAQLGQLQKECPDLDVATLLKRSPMTTISTPHEQMMDCLKRLRAALPEVNVEVYVSCMFHPSMTDADVMLQRVAGFQKAFQEELGISIPPLFFKARYSSFTGLKPETLQAKLRWMKDFGGLDATVRFVTREPHVLCLSTDYIKNHVEQLTSLLDVSQARGMSILIKTPKLLSFNVARMAENIAFISKELELEHSKVVSMVFRFPSWLTASLNALQDRINGLGMILKADRPAVSRCFQQVPSLLGYSPASVTKKFSLLQDVLDLSHDEACALFARSPCWLTMSPQAIKQRREIQPKLLNVDTAHWIKLVTTNPSIFNYNLQTMENKLQFLYKAVNQLRPGTTYEEVQQAVTRYFRVILLDLDSMSCKFQIMQHFSERHPQWQGSLQRSSLQYLIRIVLTSPRVFLRHEYLLQTGQVTDQDDMHKIIRTPSSTWTKQHPDFSAWCTSDDTFRSVLTMMSRQAVRCNIPAQKGEILALQALGLPVTTTTYKSWLQVSKELPSSRHAMLSWLRTRQLGAAGKGTEAAKDEVWAEFT